VTAARAVHAEKGAMTVLVAGGTGVVGEAAVRALLAHGHAVRLLSRHADTEARAWPDDAGGGVEAFVGDVTDAASIQGAADGCDAVLHLVGSVEGDEAQLERLNVGGTRHVVAEATRAGVPHLVYVSSLGADRGKSPYHRTKYAGEQEARRFSGRWVIVRPGNVYGPGDQQISRLLRMVRSLPAIPLIAGGTDEFQPIWADDAGEALARACERDDLAGQTLDVAGGERTSMRDLLDRFGRLTGREPIRVPVPGALATLGVKLADAVGVDLGVNESQLTMVAEGNRIDDPAQNALARVLGVTPTPLDEGLRRLLDALPEQLPDEGLGVLHHKRYWADVHGAQQGADPIFRHLCRRFQELTPAAMDVGAEPNAPESVLALHQTVTMALPMRGNVQVRVAELGDRLLTLQTVEGHPLAGAVRFRVVEREAPGGAASGPRPYRFEIEVFDRAADPFDWVAMAVVGARLQEANWEQIVRTVVDESGGEAPAGVERAADTLEGDAAERVERWLEELSLTRRRADNADALGLAGRDTADRKA
jgi:NADH dehydrogenase